MAKTYEPIASTTLGSAAASYTFTSIPGTFTDLVVVATYANSTSGYGIAVRFNSNTGSNYSDTILRGTGSTASSLLHSSANLMYTAWSGTTTSTTSPLAISMFSVMSYANTNVYKTVLSATSGGSGTDRIVGLWRNTSAINSVTLLAAPSGNLIAGSTFSIYGLAAA